MPWVLAEADAVDLCHPLPNVRRRVRLHPDSKQEHPSAQVRQLAERGAAVEGVHLQVPLDEVLRVGADRRVRMRGMDAAARFRTPPERLGHGPIHGGRGAPVVDVCGAVVEGRHHHRPLGPDGLQQGVDDRLRAPFHIAEPAE
jgi:hypothetical protein